MFRQLNHFFLFLILLVYWVVSCALGEKSGKILFLYLIIAFKNHYPLLHQSHKGSSIQYMKYICKCNNYYGIEVVMVCVLLGEVFYRFLFEDMSINIGCNIKWNTDIFNPLITNYGFLSLQFCGSRSKRFLPKTSATVTWV